MAHAEARRPLLPPGSPRRVIPRWAGPLLGTGVLLAVAVAFGGAYWDGFKVRRELGVMAGERDTLRKQIAQLREEIRLLNTPEYIERIAREQLGLIRPGEIAVILVRPTPRPTPAPR